MELWFTENHTPDARFSIRVNEQLASLHSDYQQIDIFSSNEFGRFLTLDGRVMLTEKDEFIYHEMMVHIPMAVHPKVENVLVIGAGDGGTLRELAYYPDIKTIDLVEIDEQVIEICKEFLPQTACGFDDPRVRVIIADGLKYVRGRKAEYDLILVDSTDPFGPGEGLFTKEFYGNCYAALREDGILVNQHESPYYLADAEAVRNTFQKTRSFFPICRLYQAHIPTYPSGHWLFGYCSKKYHPIRDLKAAEWEKLNVEVDYYNTNLHVGCFALPTYVLDLIGEYPATTKDSVFET